MATLEEGREYGLASNSLSEENKTIIHFKLTDAALKTLEDYAKIKNGRASIRFQENKGVISIPSFGGNHGRNFQISLSALPGDLNGSFDCIQQTTRGSSSSLESQGTMSYRVVVHATDDVYDRTRAKMTMAEEESKKVCTKEIKPSKRYIGKVTKKVLPPGSLKIPPVSKPQASVSKTPSNNGGRQSLGNSSIASLNSSSHATSPQGMSSSNLSCLSGYSRHSPTLSNPSVPSSNKLTSSSSNQQPKVLSNTKQATGAINMPYRDRVIHLLALRPYKKPELIVRLQKDGIREKDKNSLGTVLQQVAVMNRDNSYILARAGWADVRLDWQFYTEEDRILLKKNLHQVSRENQTSPAVSPASSNPESPGNSQKRVLDEVHDSNPNSSKRKRIAHADRRGPDERPVSVVKPILSQQASPNADRENFDVNADDSSEPDYLRRFKQIVDGKQRQLYKHEFNKEYSEYKELHKEVDAVARKFQHLRSQINQTEEGTPDFEVLKQQVLSEYEAQKADPNFMEKKGRMDYLHHKLGHIKRLIHDFDHRQAQVCS